MATALDTSKPEESATRLGEDLAACTSNDELSEKEICKLLDKIHERTSNANALIFYYRCQALFSQQLEKGNFTIKDGYMKLRQHVDFYRTALSLVLYMLEDCGSKEEIDVLSKYVESTRSYESDVIIQRLNLWTMLTNIATKLNESEDDVRDLVATIGYMTKTNTDHIKVNEQYSLASALEAFWLLEKKGKLEPMLKEHPPELRKGLCLYDILLSHLHKQKLVNEYVENYLPNQPLTLAVLVVERMEGTDGAHQLPAQEQLLLSAFSEYKDCLTDTYKRMLIIESDQWPPVREHFYINLALITPDFMPRSDTFSRATIRGSVDDVYKRKEQVDFSLVFPDQLAPSKHYVSLIEGRPGCGKSTLITKVSKDWAEGAILKDIDLFVLVRLRRFVGRKSLTLKDLLGVYCPNPAVLDIIHDKITRDGGKGVCFAFDGLDEYSAHLTEGNLIMKIIYGHLLPHAAVFLTSRPATSERFRRKTLLTQNIEIIGFLEEEIKGYINSYYKDDENKAYGLMKYIREHPNIERMCYLPLHIAMVAYLYDLDPNGNLLPLTETELYYKFTLHTLYRSRLKNLEDQDVDDIELHEFCDLQSEQHGIFEKVCKLAFKATLEQKQLFTGRELKKVANLPEIPRKREFDSVGLLTVDRMISQRSALPTKTFSFLHLTHQEFLAAVHIVDHLSKSEALEIVQEHAGKVHMWVVWKFLCGIHARNSEGSTNRSDIFTRMFRCLIADNVSTRLACLNMIHCAFESQSQASCVDLLSLLEGIIDVMDVALNPSDCSALGYVLTNARKESKEIDFSYCHLGPPGLAAFVQQLEAMQGELTEVNTLRLRARTDFKPVGSQGAFDLIKLLKKLPNLGELRLYGNKVKTEMFKSLAPAIADLGQIHTLILSRNDLGVDTGPLMSDVLGNLPLLHTFYISYNPLTETGLGAMKPGLLKCKKLKILGLRGNSLEEGAGVHLSDIFSTLTKLDIVELYQNRLGDKGVCDMMPGLLKSQSLRTLSLVENNISDTGALALVEYLSVTNTLRQIRIYYNNEMTDVGKIALRSAIVARPGHLSDLGLAV